MKEFVAAGNEEKKDIFAKMEEEVGKLSGSAARYTIFLFDFVIQFLVNSDIYNDSKREMVYGLPHIVLSYKKDYIYAYLGIEYGII